MFEFQATENSKLLKQERQFRVSLVIQLFKKKKKSAPQCRRNEFDPYMPQSN